MSDFTPDEAGIAIAYLIEQGYLQPARREVQVQQGERPMLMEMTDEFVVTAPNMEERVAVLDSMRAKLPTRLLPGGMSEIK